MNDDKYNFPPRMLPWFTRFSYMKEQLYHKDPASYEFVLVEDHHRSVRFERNCATPIWWYEYTEVNMSRPRLGAIALPRCFCKGLL